MIPLITKYNKKRTFNIALKKAETERKLILDFLASLNALDYEITSLEMFEEYLSEFADEILKEAKRAVGKAIEKANLEGKSPEEVVKLAEDLVEIEQTQEEIYHDEWERHKAAEREREYWEEEAKKAAEDEVGKPVEGLVDGKIEEIETTAKETETIKDDPLPPVSGGIMDLETEKAGTGDVKGRVESTGKGTIDKAKEEAEAKKAAAQQKIEDTKKAVEEAKEGKLEPVLTPGNISDISPTTPKSPFEGIMDKITGATGGKTPTSAKPGETIIVKTEDRTKEYVGKGTVESTTTVAITNTGDKELVVRQNSGSEIGYNEGTVKGLVTPEDKININDLLGDNPKGIPGTTITVTGTTTVTTPDGTKSEVVTEKTITTNEKGETTYTDITKTGDTTTIETHNADGTTTSRTDVTKGDESNVISTETSWTDSNGVSHTNGSGKDSSGNTVGYAQSENEEGVIVTEAKDGTGNTTAVTFEGTAVSAPSSGDSITIDGIGTITNNGDGTATWTDTAGNTHTGTPTVDDEGHITGIDVTNEPTP